MMMTMKIKMKCAMGKEEKAKEKKLRCCTVAYQTFHSDGIKLRALLPYFPAKMMR